MHLYLTKKPISTTFERVQNFEVLEFNKPRSSSCSIKPLVFSLETPDWIQSKKRIFLYTFPCVRVTCWNLNRYVHCTCLSNGHRSGIRKIKTFIRHTIRTIEFRINYTTFFFFFEEDVKPVISHAENRLQHAAFMRASSQQL